MRLKPLLAIALIALVAIMLSTYQRVAGGQTKRDSSHGDKTFDGAWWLSTSSAEQLGFRDGLADCHLWEIKLPLHYDRSAQEDQGFITDFYHKNPWKLSTPVYDIFLNASDQPSPVKRSGGEHFDEPHGYWDGLWWRGFNEPELSLSQKGFVEGYLWCYEEKDHSSRGTFSKPPEEYVKKITEWYDKTGPDEEKIADVLFKFRDHPSDQASKH